MAWDKFFAYAGNEVVNASRTATYARALNLDWVKDVGTTVDIAAWVNDPPYVSPALDPAPWYAANDPATAGFAGLIPISVTGIEDSSRQSNGFDYVTDGGNPGRIRHGMKEAVFSVALVGDSECAVEAGFRWLKRTLLSHPCVSGGPSACGGEILSYLSCEPSGVPDPGAFERWMRRVLVSNGPSITGKRTLKGCPGALWTVQWTARIGDPFEYFPRLDVFTGLGTEDGPDYMPGIVGPDTGTSQFTMGNCPVPVYTPIYDPSCSALVTPPPPPDLKIGCNPYPSGLWDRYYAEVPADLIPRWDEARPTFWVTNESEDPLRNVRIAVYRADGFNPTSHCDALVGEFLATYIPPEATLTIDAVENTAYIVDSTGYARRADSLLLGGANKPPVWFGLSCNEAYYVSLEHDADDADTGSLGLSLTGRTA